MTVERTPLTRERDMLATRVAILSMVSSERSETVLVLADLGSVNTVPRVDRLPALETLSAGVTVVAGDGDRGGPREEVRRLGVEGVLDGVLERVDSVDVESGNGMAAASEERAGRAVDLEALVAPLIVDGASAARGTGVPRAVDGHTDVTLSAVPS